ncbi:ephrin type-A receptor 5 isoform X2 [Nematostella vectensis]|nr:ephrin type-A receptor 5 isoform X2 [Nematostella vectensis]
MNESVIRDDFRFVQKVLASSVWTSLVTPVSNVINVTMITQRKGFYLALKDVGACVAVSGISVTYNYCPNSVINGVTYPRTVSLALRDGVTQVEGNCSTMAVQYPYNRTLVANCSASGDWQVLESDSTCMCKAGFGLLGDKCKACQNGEFKNIVGNSGCITCPGHTHSSVLRDVCICDAGFYRASVDSPLGPCYGPPSEPRNLSYTTIATGVIMVTWLQPIDTGSRSDVTYDISCHKCLAGACTETCTDVILWPSNQGLLNTHLIATLGASGDIGDVKITVFAKNGVSDLAGLGKARNGSIVLSTLGTTLSPTGTSTGRAAGNGTGTTAWVPTGAGSADTSRQVAIAIGVSFTVTLIVCIALASALIWYLRNKWRPKVINLAHLSSERTGHNGEDTFHDNSSTETDLTDSFKIWQNAQNNLSPKINAMRMYRRNSTEPLTVNKDGERESREAWTPLQGKKTGFTGLFTNNRLGSSVTVKSWFPEPQVQYDV